MFGFKRDNEDRIIYAKHFQDGTSLYFEEILSGKRNKTLRSKTLYKRRGRIEKNKILDILKSENKRNDVSGQLLLNVKWGGAGGQPSVETSITADPTVATSAPPTVNNILPHQR